MSENKDMRELNLDQLNAVVGGITSYEKEQIKTLREACAAAEAAGDEEQIEICKIKCNEYIDKLINKYGVDEVAKLFT